MALILSLTAWPQALRLLPIPPILTTVLVGCVLVLFFIASRDVLRKYYERTNALLSIERFPPADKENPMVNGCHSAGDNQEKKKAASSQSTSAPGAQQRNKQLNKARPLATPERAGVPKKK